LPDGSFQFQTLCNTGLVLTVQLSINLADWQSLQTFTNATAVSTITDTNAAGRLATFYRLAIP
jgi:hypothetical protein